MPISLCFVLSNLVKINIVFLEKLGMGHWGLGIGKKKETKHLFVPPSRRAISNLKLDALCLRGLQSLSITPLRVVSHEGETY